MDCVTLLVRWRDIRPQVEDQLPQEFQEHVTLTQGPTKPQFTSRIQNRIYKCFCRKTWQPLILFTVKVVCKGTWIK